MKCFDFCRWCSSMILRDDILGWWLRYCYVFVAVVVVMDEVLMDRNDADCHSYWPSAMVVSVFLVSSSSCNGMLNEVWKCSISQTDFCFGSFVTDYWFIGERDKDRQNVDCNTESSVKWIAGLRMLREHLFPRLVWAMIVGGEGTKRWEMRRRCVMRTTSLKSHRLPRRCKSTCNDK